LRQRKIGSILQEQSAIYKPSNVPMYDWRHDGRALLWEPLITEMVSMPDKMANKLKSEVR